MAPLASDLGTSLSVLDPPDLGGKGSKAMRLIARVTEWLIGFIGFIDFIDLLPWGRLLGRVSERLALV